MASTPVHSVASKHWSLLQLYLVLDGDLSHLQCPKKVTDVTMKLHLAWRACRPAFSKWLRRHSSLCRCFSSIKKEYCQCILWHLPGLAQGCPSISGRFQEQSWYHRANGYNQRLFILHTRDRKPRIVIIYDVYIMYWEFDEHLKPCCCNGCSRSQTKKSACIAQLRVLGRR